MTDGTTLLAGIVGSSAYGLAGPDSDIDRLGIYAAPTLELHGLHLPIGKAASRVTTNPDTTMHEAGKYLALALRCNPTITELLWLPDELYETRTPLGQELIDLRGRLLSATAVRNAYLGYATQQFKRLRDRGDGSFSSDTRKRTAKHARHLWRLLHQGHELYTTSHLTIRLTEPERCRDFGDQVPADPAVAEQLLGHFEYQFNTTSSELPDEAAAEAWLHRVRTAFYTPERPGHAPVHQ